MNFWRSVVKNQTVYIKPDQLWIFDSFCACAAVLNENPIASLQDFLFNQCKVSTTFAHFIFFLKMISKSRNGKA